MTTIDPFGVELALLLVGIFVGWWIVKGDDDTFGGPSIA
jgi:hypothetical protein